ncbi:hypothetical protein PHAMO_290117 [Magnetospirillum molischianum DSM 120]|uniref:Uncharacterized protein n=1 Tax=Magnetospirillum molischianum DSM 120 TaxID=1150626 RepID=H8FTX2_MAGML|nr:hypothetical protein PHAMO_290117 [Magnetospirillum molischianum DSM 120]
MPRTGTGWRTTFRFPQGWPDLQQVLDGEVRALAEVVAGRSIPAYSTNTGARWQCRPGRAPQTRFRSW